MGSANRQKVDYAGRTVDLLLLKTVTGVPASVRVGLDVSDGEGSPMIVAGVEKMVQRYAIAFLNAMGSTMFVPGHGTGIVPAVASGRVYSQATLESQAAEANLRASRQVRLADDGEDTPDDERLASATVEGVDFSRSRSSASISVRLTSAAGDSYTYIIPVGVGVR